MMNKLRSKLPRRKRSPISPVLMSSSASLLFSHSIHIKHLTTVEFSGDSSRVSVSVDKLKSPAVKKRVYDEANETAGKFRRITRSFIRKKTITRKEKDNEAELSDSSCVESCSGVTSWSSKSVKTREELKNINGTENSEVTARSDISRAVTSANLNFGEESLKGDVNSSANGTRENALVCNFNGIDVSEASLNCVESNFSEATSKQLPKADMDLTCTEHFSCEEDEYSSAECSHMDSSDIDSSSEYSPSMWFDSGSQFSEKSIGDTSCPSPMFQQFVLYSQQFCRSKFPEVSSHTSSDGIILTLDDKEEEESYQMLRVRERRQLYLHDYSEEYCETTDYGKLVCQQRLQMVHWIVEQSTNKEYHRETMFLGVSLLDRFLSKGYFKNKRHLQIAGIACLTLATRIEEKQPYNSIQQRSFDVEGNQYIRCEVVAMEWLVQEVLNFQCFLPTIYNFLWFYLKAAKVHEEVEKITKYLAVLTLLAHEHLCFWPSTVAAGLVILACAAANNHSSCDKTTEILYGSKDDDLSECIKSLEWLVKYIC